MCITNRERGESAQGSDKKKRRVSQNKVVRSIKRKYYNNWIVDNLPVASKVKFYNVAGAHTLDYTDTKYWQGFPVGLVDLNGHLTCIYYLVNIEVQYYAVRGTTDKFRIVGSL